MEDNNQQIKELCNGQVVVIKPSTCFIVPLFCPVCKFPIKTANDTIAYKSFECCDLCAINFAYTNKEKWLNENWRPNQEELKDYIIERQLLSKPKFNLK